MTEEKLYVHSKKVFWILWNNHPSLQDLPWAQKGAKPPNSPPTQVIFADLATVQSEL